jgi:hypothetical protein
MSRTDSKMSAIAAAGELHHVGGHAAQAERRAVDEAELTLLQRRDRSRSALLQRFREEEDGGEGAAEVVRHFHHQFEPSRSTHPLGKALGPVRLEVGVELFEAGEYGEQLIGVGHLLQRPGLLDEMPSQDREQPAAEHRPRQRLNVRLLVHGDAEHPPKQVRQPRAGLLRRDGVLREEAPLRSDPARGALERHPEAVIHPAEGGVGDGRGGGGQRVLTHALLPSRSLRWNECLSIRR